MFVVFKCFPNLGYVCPVNANRLVQLLTGYFELLGPVKDIRRNFRIDLVWILRAFLWREFPAFGKWF